MQFDLASLTSALPDTRNDRRTHLMGLVMVSVFVFFALFALAWHFAQLGQPIPLVSLVGLLAACAFFIVAGIFIAVSTTPGPTSVEVDAQGFTFTFSGGRIEQIRWSDPRLKVRLSKTDGTMHRGIPRPPMGVVLGGYPSRKYLTLEAFDEIVRRAEAQGLVVDRAPSPTPGWTRFTITRD